MKIFENIPNLLINGDMRFAQRSVGPVVPTGAAQYLTVDRWAVWFSNVGSMTSPEVRQSSLPGGFPGVSTTATALRMVSNVVGASGQYNFRQRIESIRLSNLKEGKVSFGFWGWFSNFQTIRLHLYQPTAVDNYASETSLGFVDIPVVDSQWHFYEIENIDLINRNGLAVVGFLNTPSNGAGSADAYVTETMCNEGSVVERFKLTGLYPDIELRLCQRYYERVNGRQGLPFENSASTTQGSAYWSFQTTKRATPVPSFGSTTVANSRVYHTQGLRGVNALALGAGGVDAIYFEVTLASAATQFQCGTFTVVANGVNDWIAADAEL